MTLHGLFIGVDRYAAPVSWLSCAVADATALAALFEDNFGGNVTRLLDQDATRQGILDGLETLTTSDHDDIVVISFSGHGTPGQPWCQSMWIQPNQPTHPSISTTSQP